MPATTACGRGAQKLYDAVGSSNRRSGFSPRKAAPSTPVDNRQVGIDTAADWLAET
jgi:hypothetical protein